MNKNNDRMFRVTYVESWCNDYFKLQRKIKKGSIIKESELCNYYKNNGVMIPELVEVEDFNDRFITQVEEIFDESEIEYTIDELEEDIKYLDNIFNKTYMKENGTLMVENKHESGERYFSPSGASYNHIKECRFTKVQPPKQYTFDEAKADCKENGTEYTLTSYSDNECKHPCSIQTMSKNKFGLVIIEKKKVGDRYTLENRIVLGDTWVKKSDLDR